MALGQRAQDVERFDMAAILQQGPGTVDQGVGGKTRACPGLQWREIKEENEDEGENRLYTLTMGKKEGGQAAALLVIPFGNYAVNNPSGCRRQLLLLPRAERSGHCAVAEVGVEFADHGAWRYPVSAIIGGLGFRR